MRTGRRLLRRLLWLGLLLGLLVALVGIGINVAVAGRLERVEGAFNGLVERPAAAPGQTILMVGTRPGGPGADVAWLHGEQSVEAVMLIEVPRDGMSARVETLPQSSGVRALVGSSPPSAGVAAVESWTGRRVDHLIAIDWTTFVRLADDNGIDPAYDWGSGPAVQHDFLQRVMEATLHQELRKRPWDLIGTLRTTAGGTTVDDTWSIAAMDLLVLSLRNLRSYDITYAMARPG